MFDRSVGALFLTYAARLVARGYVHNSLGNLAIRVPHPDHERGVVYTKHAGVSLEEATLDSIVVTEVATPRLLHGTRPTSVGHQLNREVLRLRPDVNAVVHVHHDESIAFFTRGRELQVLSLDFALVMGAPIHVLSSHVNVELDVAPLREFVGRTNAIVMENHGVTTFGRTVSEAYHRLNTLAAEVRRNITALSLAAATGDKVQVIDAESVEWAYRHGDSVIFPDPAAAPALSPSSRRGRAARPARVAPG
jgi:ribulose-5-phosphate 4-epimerase/fuculose-1-phosphate aldolase